MQPNKGSDTIVVSALTARTGFGKLLHPVENENRSLVIEKRGTPKAVLLSIRDYVSADTQAASDPADNMFRACAESARRLR
jgi:prevent-host-death family protein